MTLWVSVGGLIWQWVSLLGVSCSNDCLTLLCSNCVKCCICTSVERKFCFCCQKLDFSTTKWPSKTCCTSSSGVNTMYVYYGTLGKVFLSWHLTEKKFVVETSKGPEWPVCIVHCLSTAVDNRHILPSLWCPLRICLTVFYVVVTLGCTN